MLLVRERLGLPKTHATHAVAIGLVKHFKIVGKVEFIGPSLREWCVASGDCRQTMGRRSEKRGPTGKVCGFRKCDKVLYGDIVCFIKGKRFTGCMELMDITGRSLNMKSRKYAGGLVRLSARTSCLI